MKVLCLGGGPAGLYFAISMKLRDPAHEVTLLERNACDATFGWGVVLSDDALGNMERNDPKSTDAIRQHFAYWDDIAVIHRGERTVSGGHGFAGIGRMLMLQLLQDRARELGVDMRFQTPFTSAEEFRRDYDLVVACDGINSLVRQEYRDVFRPEVDNRLCKFVWLGTHQKFDDAFTFIFEETEHGWMWIHAYQFDADTATVIVECTQPTWDAWGFEHMTKEETIATCEHVFAKHLGGHSLMSNAGHLRGSAVWMNFPRVICEQWHHENVVLMGDAAATAHFSVGSGSRLAFDSAIALADYLHSEPTMEAAFERYQEERRIEVLRLQSAARNSLEWFEQVERYLDLDPVQFNYSLLTRSQRISHENLRLRDPEWLRSAEDWFQARAGGKPGRAPMFAPFRLRGLELDNRVVVSPMAQYKAVDGCPNDWHFVHYAERAKGGAGLVYTEMTCVSPEGRITPGCTGLYAPEHEEAWKRLTDFVHAETNARVCCQVGHSGRKGSTQLGWEQIDTPLVDGNWPVMSASAIPWSADSAIPKEMDRSDMDAVTAEFVASTQMVQRAGFDMIELHAAHGYLISSFISPLSNRRQDEYGGDLDGRMRFPLEVFTAMRAVWPDDKPMSVRISANDWVGDDGVTPDEAVEIARMFSRAGADIIDVSAGQTSVDAQPVYGRMFQTPFSDRIRNEAGIATMAVGNIYEPDHANSILMAGRADLVCLARPHLADPYWTLRAALALDDADVAWPLPYLQGRDQALRLAQRAQETIRALTLEGRRVLITGGGTGVGADLARGFSASGADVVVVGRRREPLDFVAATDARITAIVGDVTDEADIVGVFVKAGPVDIVIANAGEAESAPLTKTSIELWERMLAVNLTGAFLTLRSGLRQMEGRGWGRLITVASTAGLKGYAYVSAYTAAKHGAVGLTRAAALDVAGTGITANALCPSYLNTAMTERTVANIMQTTGRSHADALRMLTRVNPQGRLIEPAEVTAAALWLCGPGSEAINGQAIAIAGGEL